MQVDLKIKSLLVFIVFGATLCVHANIIRVPEDERKIQYGINKAAEGDTVLVFPGTFKENISFRGKNITVGSLYLLSPDTTYIDNTIIDGAWRWRVVSFQNQENDKAVLDGFTITGGYVLDIYEQSPYTSGAGIYCGYKSGPTLRNLKIFRNGASGFGGGIYCGRHSNPVLENIILSGNDAYNGGAIYFDYNCGARLTNVTISNNSAYYIGGGVYHEYEASPTLKHVIVKNNKSRYAAGVYCYVGSRPVMKNVIISGNKAFENGGGLQCYYSSPVLQNVTIYGNSASIGGGVYCGDGSNPILVNTILWNNSPQEIYFSWIKGSICSVTLAHSDIKGGLAGIVTNDNGPVLWLEGNINADPLFKDKENGDYRLLSKSPCIDAGTNLFVWENDTLVNKGPDDYRGYRSDMGAYESDFFSIINEQPRHAENYILYQNYPNPFNPVTTISYHLDTVCNIELVIYNQAGQKIKTLVKGIKPAGYYQLEWDGCDINGVKLPSGLYFYTLKTKNFMFTRKMIMLR